MIIRFLFLLLPLLIFTGCGNNANHGKVVELIEDNDIQKPAVTSNLTSPKVQLRHMFVTDYEDRLTGTFLINPERDSLRLSRTTDLLQSGMVRSWEDKYHAAFIFIHAGGPFQNKEEAINYKIAWQLFAEVSQKATDNSIRLESAFYANRARDKYVEASS